MLSDCCRSWDGQFGMEHYTPRLPPSSSRSASLRPTEGPRHVLVELRKRGFAPIFSEGPSRGCHILSHFPADAARAVSYIALRTERVRPHDLFAEIPPRRTSSSTPAAGDYLELCDGLAQLMMVGACDSSQFRCSFPSFHIGRAAALRGAVGLTRSVSREISRPRARRPSMLRLMPPENFLSPWLLRMDASSRGISSSPWPGAKPDHATMKTVCPAPPGIDFSGVGSISRDVDSIWGKSRMRIPRLSSSWRWWGLPAGIVACGYELVERWGTIFTRRSIPCRLWHLLFCVIAALFILWIADFIHNLEIHGDSTMLISVPPLYHFPAFPFAALRETMPSVVPASHAFPSLPLLPPASSFMACHRARAAVRLLLALCILFLPQKPPEYTAPSGKYRVSAVLDKDTSPREASSPRHRRPPTLHPAHFRFPFREVGAGWMPSSDTIVLYSGESGPLAYTISRGGKRWSPPP